jgi:DNA-nicking Smr family endonuclease
VSREDENAGAIFCELDVEQDREAVARQNFMNSSDAKFFAAEIGADILTLDLHGSRISEIDEKIDRFLFDSHNSKEQVVKIIHGGGTGRLKQAIAQIVSEHPLVEDFKEDFGNIVALVS